MLKPVLNENIIINAVILKLLEKFLPEKALLQYQQGAVATEYLRPYVKRIKQISQAYTGLRAPSDLQIEEAISYALYFLPINFIKVLRALALLPEFSKPTIQILDFGAGPGTASLASQYFFKKDLIITQVEHLRSMREVAYQLNHQRVKFVKNIEEAKASYDLIICANSINELAESQAESLLSALVQKLAPNGCLLVLEPALLQTTRRMMKLRDYLTKSLSVIYPCTHQNSCPLLEDESQWCHTELDWERPLLTRQFDELLGFNKHKIKTNIFIFSHQSVNCMAERVVNFPVKLKYGKELLLCGAQGLRKKVVAKQDKYLINYSLFDESAI